ncbi:hypothetical protein [Vibrio owensii]|uniref:hypothetical protein n=1 Tax=Vibrio owensii TaxID=696485 RepID=UPI0018F168D7|nr:hypothetical protein [Vibrio owensii]
MEKKHRIKVFTSPDLVSKAHNHYRVKVIWEVDFEESLVPYLSNKHVKHDAEDLKRGFGELTVEVPVNKFPELSQTLAYAEVSALVYLVEKRGLNVFGVNKGVLVQKVQLQVSPSQMLSRGLLQREDSYVSALSKSADASLLGYTDFAAAYFYGSEVVDAGGDWYEAFSSSGSKPEYYNAIRAAQVKKLLEIRTAIGVLHMTYRTVDEFLRMPLHRELVAEKGQRFTRPFESAVERVRAATSLVSSENKHLIKLKKKLGDNAASMFCETPPTFVDLKLMDGSTEPHYVVIGFRALYSLEVMERLKKGGYTYHT